MKKKMRNSESEHQKCPSRWTFSNSFTNPPFRAILNLKLFFLQASWRISNRDVDLTQSYYYAGYYMQGT